VLEVLVNVARLLLLRLNEKNPQQIELKDGRYKYAKTNNKTNDATQALGAIVMLRNETWLLTVKVGEKCIERALYTPQKRLRPQMGEEGVCRKDR
jgi:hypothetical protein